MGALQGTENVSFRAPTILPPPPAITSVPLNPGYALGFKRGQVLRSYVFLLTSDSFQYRSHCSPLSEASGGGYNSFWHIPIDIHRAYIISHSRAYIERHSLCIFFNYTSYLWYASHAYMVSHSLKKLQLSRLSKVWRIFIISSSA